MKKESIDLVREFHELTGCPVVLAPEYPNPSLQNLRINLQTEELNEGREAKDIYELADSLGDQQYVLDGWFWSAGLASIKHLLLEEIHRSNMTKGFDSESEAYEARKTLHTAYYESTLYPLPIESWAIVEKFEGSGKYIVKRYDGKILKGPNYSPANLKAIIDGVLLLEKDSPMQTGNEFRDEAF